MATMAAFSELPPPKKRPITYGKSSRKRFPFTQVERKRTSEPLPSRDASPAAPVVDIFDVPSSDDDERLLAAESRKRKLGTTQKTHTASTTPLKKIRTQPPTLKTTSHLPKTTNELPKSTATKNTKLPVLGVKKAQNKRIKSPAMLSQSELRMSAIRNPSMEQSVKKGTMGQELARPKQSLAGRPAKNPKAMSATVVDQMASVSLYTPKKKIPIDPDTIMSTPSPSTPTSTKATSNASRQSSISPEGKRMWQDLLGEADPVREKKSRRRLIDTLIEQRADSEDSEEDSDFQEEHERQKSVDYPEEPHISESQETIFSQWEPMERDEDTPMQTAVIQTLPQKTGPKTYASKRFILTESAEDFESQLVMDMPLEEPAARDRRQGRGGVPSLKPLESLHEAEDEASGMAIRSVHEVRMAGAKNHFVDGVEHLLGDIGTPQAKPSSSRRSALMDLASKLLQKDYRQQFLDNGLEQRLFFHLGEETDIVAGFLLASLLFIVLSESKNSLTVEQLCQQGISRLLVRLLDIHQSIAKIARDRKSNMSKVAQSLILEYQTMLLKSELWEEPDQSNVSPRTITMRCIKTMVEQSRDGGSVCDIISKEMTSRLFGILKDFPAVTLAEISKDKDCQLALSAIEFHSQKGLSGDISTWTSSYLPFVYNILLKTLTEDEILLRMDGELKGCFDTLLKLVLSVVHENQEAAAIFSTQQLIATMGKAVVTIWERLSGDLNEAERSTALEILNVLTLILMEIAGTSQPVRLSFNSLKDTDDDFIPGMVQVFNDREESSSQVVTPDETNECVPLGFLAFLLGHLCQESIIRDRVASHLLGGRIRYLAKFIKRTIGMLKTANESSERNPMNNLNDLIESLETMVSNIVNPN